MKLRNDQMLRTAVFKRSGRCIYYPGAEFSIERDKWIEKDNMNLLQKLEDIKRKGTVSDLHLFNLSVTNSLSYPKEGRLVPMLISWILPE